jgi:hypothetical protein
MTPDTESHLDPALLERVRLRGGKLVARCPACAEEQQDRRAEHLVIFPSGKFACAAHPGDGAHRRRIFALAGVIAERRMDEQERRQRRERHAREMARERKRQYVRDTAQGKLRELLASYPWEPVEAWEDSPQRPDGPLVVSDPRHFLATLFPPDALLWTGEVHHSGPAHAAHWRTCEEWQAAADGEIGPMVSPALWQPSTVSRTMGAVAMAPYTVMDFDGFNGVKPVTPAERDAHLRDSLALIRWLREGMGWHLAAILHTGGKSLHAWFRTPGPEVIETLRATAQELGIDAGLIGRPEHPCRLPGQRHAGTGGWSQVLWLRESAPTPLTPSGSGRKF